jgi:hypothetical protein
MGIRDKEKSRQDIKSNVGVIVGVEKAAVRANEDLTQKAYYITKEQYRKLRVLSANRDADMSYLIREMLDKYLAGY